jgi:VacB/RNase II family 3'-5' exoribonuclease
MRLVDRQGALARGLLDIRTQFAVPPSFPPPVLAAAEAAAAVIPKDRADWRDRHFVTLDPASSTDLDQAFTIERAGSDLILHYAIADVGFFVHAGDPLDVEAWRRGTTIYLPDGKASLYPASLSEGAASLLPDVDRPAVVFSVRVDQEGNARLEGAIRATVRSRAKLAYESVTPADLPPDFAELSDRIEQAENARGAERIDAPEQALEPDVDGRLVLAFRPQLQSEQQNAALSLAANLAIAEALLAHRTGLFRVMAEPDERAVSRLRHTAKALGLVWPKGATLAQFERTLDAGNPRHAAFRAAVRRAGPGASYAPYEPGVLPWHSAMAATYAHATAPLRRLADRFVIEAALLIANGRPVPDALGASFEMLPKAMATAENRAGQIERAVLDLAEAVMLEGREGARFDAVVTDVDERGARIQLSSPAVVARVDGKGAMPGDAITVELEAADIVNRQVHFRRVH